MKRPSVSLNLMPPEVINSTPRLYAQSELSANEAIVHVHLFGPVGDFWLTEVAADGTEAFGYIRLSSQPENAELGYISITELQELVDENFIAKKDLRFMIERDLHWNKCTLADVQS